MEFSKADSTFEKDFNLLQLFYCFYCKSPSKDKYNSSKLRKIICKTEAYCISSKTFDQNINELNEKIRSGNAYFSNPAFQSPNFLSSTSSSHSQIFYRRLPFCLNLTGQEYKEQKESETLQKSREKLYNIFFKQASLPPTFQSYIFEIRNFYMPPFFTPLFVGIVGSLKKEKTSWESFRKNALEISEIFYSENHPEINEFIPEAKDMRVSLYNFWLELHFPDELFNLIEKYEEIIKTNNDPLLSHNLTVFMSKFQQLNFLTRTGQKKFLLYMDDLLQQYLNTPLIDPDTCSLRDIDLSREFFNSLVAIQSSEQEYLHLYSKIHNSITQK